MKNTSHLFAMRTFALLILSSVGCAANKPVPPVEAPTTVSSAAIMPPTPVVLAVSPNVSVSKELAEACKIRFNNAESAPKFDFDESHLDMQDSDVLTQVAKCVTSGPLAGRALDLVGRADPRGEGAYNMALGDRRATTVRDYLSGLGVSASSLTMRSRGKMDATGTDEAGWTRDRRVDILLK